MSTVNYVNPNLDRTVRILDDFYKYETTVNENEYDVVYAFFRSVFVEELAAKNFTISLFFIADQTRVPVLELLSEMQSEVPVVTVKNNQGQSVTDPAVKNQGSFQLKIQSTMAYYLNNLRSNATLLGVSAAVTPNYYAARNVLP